MLGLIIYFLIEIYTLRVSELRLRRHFIFCSLCLSSLLFFLNWFFMKDTFCYIAATKIIMKNVEKYLHNDFKTKFHVQSSNILIMWFHFSTTKFSIRFRWNPMHHDFSSHFHRYTHPNLFRIPFLFISIDRIILDIFFYKTWWGYRLFPRTWIGKWAKTKVNTGKRNKINAIENRISWKERFLPFSYLAIRVELDFSRSVLFGFHC